jgi:hypothetical protein
MGAGSLVAITGKARNRERKAAAHRMVNAPCIMYYSVNHKRAPLLQEREIGLRLENIFPFYETYLEKKLRRLQLPPLPTGALGRIYMPKYPVVAGERQ